MFDKFSLLIAVVLPLVAAGRRSSFQCDLITCMIGDAVVRLVVVAGG